jgi:DNA primase
MGRIPQNFIDDLVARVDIVEVINARVPLKKKGREYSACCPFHNEKTPSFTVSETKQFYHCFGCGAHGTAIGFLMEYEHLDFVDAVETLAAEYHIEVPREDSPHTGGSTEDDRQPLYDVLERAAKLYQQQLRTSERAINYLKQRGLSGEIAQRYRMGYAPEGWNFLLDNLGKNKTGIRHLLGAGLLIEKAPDRYYDRFRDRIMFPILDRRGRVIGFGGRILDQGEPKYLNSPETTVFHKGLELYGMYEARQAVRKLERICIVEGYMDVVALAQNGIEYAIASLGTATTGEQIHKTFRSVREIIFCYDGDNAGRKAAWRALENTLPILRDGMIARFLLLPEGEDPDTLVRKEGKERFEQRLENATPLSDFLFEHLQQEHDITSSEGKAGLAERTRPLFAKMPDSILRELLLNKLAGLLDIDAQKLATPTSTTPQTPKPAILQQAATPQKGPAELRVCIALLLQHPPLATLLELPDDFRESEVNGVALFYAVYRTIVDNPAISAQAILERWRDRKELPILERLSILDIPGADKSDIREQLYLETTNRLISRLHYETRYEALQAKVEAGGMNALSKAELEEYRELISGVGRATRAEHSQG